MTEVRKKQMHIIKLHTRYMEAVNQGQKNFEVRYNDRDYQVGDLLVMYEVDNQGCIRNGLAVKEITYVLESFEALKSDWVVLGLAPNDGISPETFLEIIRVMAEKKESQMKEGIESKSVDYQKVLDEALAIQKPLEVSESRFIEEICQTGPDSLEVIMKNGKIYLYTEVEDIDFLMALYQEILKNHGSVGRFYGLSIKGKYPSEEISEKLPEWTELSESPEQIPSQSPNAVLVASTLETIKTLLQESGYEVVGLVDIVKDYIHELESR